jgi:N-acetylglutamate synthase-like GNAT family acetyltransferase
VPHDTDHLPLIREATAADAAALLAVDRASLATFVGAGIVLPDEGYDALTGDVLLVSEVDAQVVGVAAVRVHGDWWHLEQISVDPAHGGRGIGTALLLEVVARADAVGARGVTLTTFRDVAFNGPWYARHGFVEVDEDAHPWLTVARTYERGAGVDVRPRCAMALSLGQG